MLIQHRSVLNHSGRLRWNATPLLGCRKAAWFRPASGFSCSWIPSMHRLWKLVVSEWIAVNTGPRVSRPVTFWVVSTEQRKNPFSRWNGGEVWITHVAPGWCGDGEKEAWKDPLQLLFSFLFSLCSIYQWDGDIRVWNRISGVCLMTFLAVWRRWKDVFVFTEYFHILSCETENAKVRNDHWLSYLRLSQGSLKFGWSWGPDK